MLIKSRNFTPNKCEKTFEADGFGWAPGYEKKFEGSHKNSQRYGKNYSRMKGMCLKCDKYKPDVKVTGSGCEYCSLPENEHCQK